MKKFLCSLMILFFTSELKAGNRLGIITFLLINLEDKNLITIEKIYNDENYNGRFEAKKYGENSIKIKIDANKTKGNMDENAYNELTEYLSIENQTLSLHFLEGVKYEILN